MTTLQRMKNKLSTSEGPIEEVLSENEFSKVSLIGFSNGMMLREKQVPKTTKLMVIYGTVNYLEADKKVTLNKYDEYFIPADVRHYIIAHDCSLCLLTQDRLNQDN